MRFARTLLAHAALCTAAACADGASRITAPEEASRSESGGTWVGSGNVVSPGGGWIGSGTAAGTGDVTEPADSTGDGRGGGWGGSGN